MYTHTNNDRYEYWTQYHMYYIIANNTADHEDKMNYNKMQCIITHSIHEAVRYG
jgi:hypothetical protein